MDETERETNDHDDRVRFLLQGQASPGRGFEPLLELWSSLDEPRALLQLRCPDGAYPRELRERYADLAREGRIEWLEPVSERELIAVARGADVGVIPYVGPNPNHLYACPNKLSQYMAAGLAILSTELPYVRELVQRFDSGLTFDSDPGRFGEVVSRLVHDEALRSRLQANALRAARESFNWEEVSEPYARALARLLEVAG
jgi:glycosyltransferase involved in cell wall biosynthesis